MAVPHATRDAHARPSFLVLVAYVDIDWTRHDELVSRTSAARALGMRVGRELGAMLSASNPATTEQLREGTFLAERRFDLSHETPVDGPFWKELLSAVARFRGIRGVALRSRSSAKHDRVRPRETSRREPPGLATRTKERAPAGG